MNSAAALLIGALCALIFVLYAKRLPNRTQVRVLGRGLVIAGLVYLVFASTYGFQWLLLELVGATLCAGFYAASLRNANWLSIGWALHPAWDVLLHLRNTSGGYAPEWYVLACIPFDLIIAVYCYRHFNHRQSHPSNRTTADA